MSSRADQTTFFSYFFLVSKTSMHFWMCFKVIVHTFCLVQPIDHFVGHYFLVIFLGFNGELNLWIIWFYALSLSLSVSLSLCLCIFLSLIISLSFTLDNLYFGFTERSKLMRFVIIIISFTICSKAKFLLSIPTSMIILQWRLL